MDSLQNTKGPLQISMLVYRHTFWFHNDGMLFEMTHWNGFIPTLLRSV